MADGLRLAHPEPPSPSFHPNRPLVGSGLLSHRIRSEFQEMPGTCLTLAQATRLFGMSLDVGLFVLRHVVDAGLLQVTVEERYRSGPQPRKPMARANRRVAGDRTAKKPAPDDIARKAFDIHVARGGEHGHDLEDWLKPGSELLASLVSRRRPRAD